MPRQYIHMFVYILQCSDDSYYVGVTNDMSRRLNQHQNGMYEGSYTSIRLPVKLVYQEGFDSAQKAINFEKRIKKWSRSKKEALIRGELRSLPDLSRKKFDK